jgi:hypothetical protein
MNVELANSLRPVSEPRLLDNIYTDDQHRRLVEVVRREGPWKLILAQHFASAEEVVATLSGNMPEGVTPTFDMFLTTHFRGYLGEHGTCYYLVLECEVRAADDDAVQYPRPSQLPRSRASRRC